MSTATAGDDLEVGQTVKTAPSVLPKRFAGQSGVIREINATDGEIGVRLGSQTSHTASVWLKPHEVEAS